MEVNFLAQDRGLFLVIALGIIYDKENKKILIGRRENDQYIPELEWCFPGGRPAYGEQIEDYLKKMIKTKTNVDIKVKDIILARVPKENEQFLLIYHYCEPTSIELKAGEKFVEVKWISPDEIKEYFTTSIDQRMLKFLKTKLL